MSADYKQDEAALPPVAGSGSHIAKRLEQPEYCCEIVGSNRFPGRYFANGCHQCRIMAKWEIAGRFYCTRHAKQRRPVFQNAEPIHGGNDTD